MAVLNQRFPATTGRSRRELGPRKCGSSAVTQRGSRSRKPQRRSRPSARVASTAHRYHRARRTCTCSPIAISGNPAWIRIRSRPAPLPRNHQVVPQTTVAAKEKRRATFEAVPPSRAGAALSPLSAPRRDMIAILPEPALRAALDPEWRSSIPLRWLFSPAYATASGPRLRANRTKYTPHSSSAPLRCARPGKRRRMARRRLLRRVHRSPSNGPPWAVSV